MKIVAKLLAVVVVAIAGTTAADQVELDIEAQRRAGVRVDQVSERGFGDRIRVVGQIVRSPGSTSTVKTVLPGRIEGLAVAPGDHVARGQVLIELHSHELLRLQADLLRAGGALRLAENRAQAGRELHELEGISRLELESREQEALAARLELDALRAELVDLGFSEQTLEALLTTRSTDPHLPVRAPVDAVVLELLVEAHEWVQPYDGLLVLGSPGAVELELQLPPSLVAGVAASDQVHFAPVGSSGLGGTATVITRVPQVDPTTRTVRLRARIDRAADAPLPGTFVEGTLAHGETRMAVAVPESAVIRVAADDVVFVRTGERSFEARPVRLGTFDGSHYEVIGGLAAADQVVVAGVFLLKSALLAEGE
jgi:RND family efflux transporter MFP subunit